MCMTLSGHETPQGTLIVQPYLNCPASLVSSCRPSPTECAAPNSESEFACLRFVMKDCCTFWGEKHAPLKVIPIKRLLSVLKTRVYLERKGQMRPPLQFLKHGSGITTTDRFQLHTEWQLVGRRLLTSAWPTILGLWKASACFWCRGRFDVRGPKDVCHGPKMGN